MLSNSRTTVKHVTLHRAKLAEEKLGMLVICQALGRLGLKCRKATCPQGPCLMGVCFSMFYACLEGELERHCGRAGREAGRL